MHHYVNKLRQNVGLETWTWRQIVTSQTGHTKYKCPPYDPEPEVKASRNGPERRSGKRIIAGTAFRLEFLVGWYYDADATMAVSELY